MELRIADYQDYQNYINAHRDEEQEAIDRELRYRDNEIQMLEEQNLVSMADDRPMRGI